MQTWKKRRRIKIHGFLLQLQDDRLDLYVRRRSGGMDVDVCIVDCRKERGFNRRSCNGDQCSGNGNRVLFNRCGRNNAMSSGAMHGYSRNIGAVGTMCARHHGMGWMVHRHLRMSQGHQTEIAECQLHAQCRKEKGSHDGIVRIYAAKTTIFKDIPVFYRSFLLIHPHVPNSPTIKCTM